MLQAFVARRETFPLARPFRISRGTKTAAEVVTVELSAQGVTGRGEGVPYPRYGESVEGALAAIEAVRAAVLAGLTRAELMERMPAGAARNAVDCALFDLEGKRAAAAGQPFPALTPPTAVATALTIGIDTPGHMAEAAAPIATVPLLKVKVDREQVEERLRAIRAVAPGPRLIVDPNESWTMADVVRLQPLLAELRVDLLEQPLPAGNDDALEGFVPLVAIAADESAHVAGDVQALARKYQVVNIKLDKTGGLTAALDLAKAASAAGLRLMTGCMVCSSLSIAPALQLAARSDFVDLDGPLWLRQDRPGGVREQGGMLLPPKPGFWGFAPGGQADGTPD